MPTPRLGHPPWGLASLSHHPYIFHSPTYQKSPRQQHKHPRDSPSLTARLNVLLMLETTSLHRLPYFPSITLSTLHLSDTYPMASTSHLANSPHFPWPITLQSFGIFQPIAPMFRRHLPLNWLANIRQTVSTAFVWTLFSIIQSPKWALAYPLYALPVQIIKVSYLHKVWSHSRETQQCPPILLSSKIPTPTMALFSNSAPGYTPHFYPCLWCKIHII